MGETGIHARVALVDIYGVLYAYFLNNPRVAVHANMFVYYVQGDPKQSRLSRRVRGHGRDTDDTIGGRTRSGRRARRPTWCSR